MRGKHGRKTLADTWNGSQVLWCISHTLCKFAFNCCITLKNNLLLRAEIFGTVKLKAFSGFKTNLTL